METKHTPHGYMKFGMILAANARVQAMVAENQHRLSCGNSIAYGEEAFSAEANWMEDLARDIGEHAGSRTELDMAEYFNPDGFGKSAKPKPSLRKLSRFKFVRWLRWWWKGSAIGCFKCTIKEEYDLKCPYCGTQYNHGFPGS